MSYLKHKELKLNRLHGLLTTVFKYNSEERLRFNALQKQGYTAIEELWWSWWQCGIRWRSEVGCWKFGEDRQYRGNMCRWVSLCWWWWKKGGIREPELQISVPTAHSSHFFMITNSLWLCVTARFYIKEPNIWNWVSFMLGKRCLQSHCLMLLHMSKWQVQPMFLIAVRILTSKL